MPFDPINVGGSGNDHTGDPIRTGGGKINAMFAELFGLLPWPRVIPALEDLDPGDPVHLVADGSPGVISMEKADAADTSKPADGFVIGGVGSGNDGEFFPLGFVLTSEDSPAPYVEGSRYFVAAGGGLTDTMPTTTGQAQQEMAIALSDTELLTYRQAVNEAP